MQTLTKTYTGAKILIKTLTLLGCDSIFGYPGGIVLSVYDELAQQNDIKHYLVRHEQAAVHAAEGYARVSGKCGVALVTSGPGATNIVTGLANAYLDGFPLVVITGQVSAELLQQDAFQEVNIIDITKSCTKKNFQVKSIETLQSTLKEAFEVATTGKKGPVVVDITKNVFSQQAEISEINFQVETPKYSYENINEAVDALSKAQKPVIITGGGSIDASDELKEFADMHNIPVVSTMMGLGVYPANGKNFKGMVGIFGNANKIVRDSDLIIAIGTRFNDRIRGCLGNFEQKLIRIDLNQKELYGHIDSSIKILGDAKEALSLLISKTQKLNKDFTNLEIPEYTPQKRSDRIHSFEVMQAIGEYLSSTSPVVTTEVGQHQVWASRYLKFNSPRKFITSGGLGTMGFGFPAAIGASIAQNNAPVVCIAGDGSFQMNLQEIATCMDYNLPVKVFILNNGYLGMVRQFQEKICNERYYATKISNPDFVKLAESYGALGLRIEKTADIKPAIETAMNHNGPAIIDILIEPEELL